MSWFSNLIQSIQAIEFSSLYSPMQNKILLYMAIPVYAIFIPLEWIVSNFEHQRWYGLKETLSNIYLNIVNAIIDGAFRMVAIGILFSIYYYKVFTISNVYIYWVALFLLEDIAFYFEHRVDHYCRFFWAAHVTHHSSTEYNLSTGFRSSVLMPFYRFLYFMPLALIGFHPIDIAFMYAATQTYGILVHTQAIKKMPTWFEWLFVSPGHHRVHHASNIVYLDKNMGMCLIIWDRIFGTFQQELPEHKIQYGIVSANPEPYHPVGIITHEWSNIWKDVTQPNLTLKQRWSYVFNPPGWSHDGSTYTAKQLREQMKA